MIDEEARQAVATTVNGANTHLYWRIGKRINQETLKRERAGYGEEILATLSQTLSWSHFREVFPLPPKELLREKLHRAIALARKRLENRKLKSGAGKIGKLLEGGV